MNRITVDIDTMRDARTSANFNGIMAAYETLMEEGYYIQVNQDYNNATSDELFRIDNYEQFNNWVENNCPTQL